MVFMTTSRGTDEVQLTSNMISSVLYCSRSTWILSTTSSAVPNRFTSWVVSGLAEPASVLPMPIRPEKYSLASFISSSLCSSACSAVSASSVGMRTTVVGSPGCPASFQAFR